MNSSVSKIIKLAVLFTASIACVAVPAVLLSNKHDEEIHFDVPVNWDTDYVESAVEYKKHNYATQDWSIYKPNVDEAFTTVNVDLSASNTSFEIVADAPIGSIKHQTARDREICLLTENDAWRYISNGIFTAYPTSSFASNKDRLVKLQQSNTETITVRCWYWRNPKSDLDMEKVTVTKTFAVNSALADTFIHIFQDIYDDPTQPIINIGDGGMGTWVLRGKLHNSNSTMSAHSLGAAIDINPSTGSFYVNGTWYGNAYGQKSMPYYIWKSLPECHKKYHVLYSGSPIVEIFKAYGFYWGGDWKTGTDAMHLSFIGDGSNARSVGIANYQSSRY